MSEQIRPLEVLSGKVAPGCYRVDAARLEGFADAAAEAGWRVATVDIATLPAPRGKHELLAAVGAALDFPSWYGANLDALADCLRDVDHRPGSVLLVTGWSRAGSGAESVAEVLAERATEQPAFATLLS